MHLLTCPPHHPEIQGCSPQIVTNKSTNPLIQNNFALNKLEVGLEIIRDFRAMDDKVPGQPLPVAAHVLA